MNERQIETIEEARRLLRDREIDADDYSRAITRISRIQDQARKDAEPIFKIPFPVEK